MVKRAPMALGAGMVVLAALAATLANQPVFAQWRVTQDTPAGVDNRIDVAIIANDSGHQLRLYNDEAQNVRGIFTIRDGFDTIDPAVCPTYSVDEREPKRVTFEGEHCHILPRQTEFTLGKSGLVANRDLRRIMNGSNIVFRYRMQRGNYRETTFTLRGSKYAVTTAMEDPNFGYDE